MSIASKNAKFRAAQKVKMAFFGTSKWPKLISRKIWVAEKSWNFHIVFSQLGCPGLYRVRYSLGNVSNFWKLKKKILRINRNQTSNTYWLITTKQTTMLQKLSKCEYKLHFSIFREINFGKKSRKLPFLQFQRLSTLNFGKFRIWEMAQIY